MIAQLLRWPSLRSQGFSWAEKAYKNGWTVEQLQLVVRSVGDFDDFDRGILDFLLTVQ